MNRGVSAPAPRLESSVVAALDPGDAAIFETFVNPRYLRHFADLCVELLSPPGNPGDAVVAHFACRTGYPARQIVEALGPTRLVGTDPSLAALELARAKASAIADLSADYRPFRTFPSPLPDGSFSHALVLHPPGSAASRLRFEQDAARVLVPGGQLLVALPVAGSFVEVADLLREYAVKFDVPKLAEAIDTAVAMRPTAETLVSELTALGFVDVDIETRNVQLPFQGGRDFLEDPTVRLLLQADWRATLDCDESTLRAAFSYAREAIDKYWSEGGFDIGVVVGCVRGYRG